jgi:hypothetical protein
MDLPQLIDKASFQQRCAISTYKRRKKIRHEPQAVLAKRRARVVSGSGVYAGDDTVEYPFMGPIQSQRTIGCFWEVMEHQIPVIYFLGVSPGRYQPIIPGIRRRLVTSTGCGFNLHSGRS